MANRLCLVRLGAAALSSFAPALLAAQSAVDWHAYADCAAGYRANWQDRLTDPTRPPSMRDMIRGQADDYQAAAVRHYRQETGAEEQPAQDTVAAYVDASLERFIAMDKKDELNDFLDRCPQPDDSGNL
jgi:hypothetical protein